MASCGLTGTCVGMETEREVTTGLNADWSDAIGELRDCRDAMGELDMIGDSLDLGGEQRLSDLMTLSELKGKAGIRDFSLFSFC